VKRNLDPDAPPSVLQEHKSFLLYPSTMRRRRKRKKKKRESLRLGGKADRFKKLASICCP
jgi:hypothetical protein